MKKKLSILSLLLVFTMTAMAQIEFISNGNVIPDGSEFNVYAHTEDYGGGFKFTEYSGYDPFIKNTGNEATTITVTIKKDNPEDAIIWCGITDQCALINAGVEKASRSASVKAGESVFLAAHYSFDEGVYKTVSFEVTASGGGVTRTIHMNIIYAETVNQYPINFDKDANAGRVIDRPLRSVSITAAGAEKQTLTVNSSKAYNDLTTGTKFTCGLGATLKAEFDYGGGWMHGYVYLDADNDGEFSFDASQNDQTGKDLVSYSFYGPTTENYGFNSAGKYMADNDRNTLDCPEFTAPEVAGEYRVRFKIDWNNVDAGGCVDVGNDIINNGGYIVDAILVVEDPRPVYLTNGEDYTNSTERETERITYTRKFNNTQWQAWYVPFDIDYDAISDDFTAASLNAVHQYDDDEDGVFERWTLEILKLKSGEVLRANMPYMIRAKETGEHNFVVENAILYPAEENSLDCSSVRVHYTFKGNYNLMDGQELRDNGWFAPGGGSLVTPTVGSNLKAYRWLLMPEARSGYGTFYAPKRINIVIGDEEGEVTGIEEVTQEEWPADVYDLNGRMVKAQAENLDELPKGVYIVNGKKLVK